MLNYPEVRGWHASVGQAVATESNSDEAVQNSLTLSYNFASSVRDRSCRVLHAAGYGDCKADYYQQAQIFKLSSHPATYVALAPVLHKLRTFGKLIGSGILAFRANLVGL